MRFLLGMCAVALALSAALAGCGEPEAPEKVEYFDRDVDGVLPPPPARMRRHILAGPDSADDAEEGSGGSGSSGTATEVVKGVVAKMKVAVATDKLLVLADHYNPVQAAIAKQYIKAVADEKAAMVEARTVVVGLGPTLMTTLMSIAGAYEGPWDMLGQADLESLAYNEASGAIQVWDQRDPRKALVFTNVGGQWVYTYLPWACNEAQKLPGLARLAGARAAVLTAIAEGVRQATINAANFEENVAKLIQGKIAPLLNGAAPPTPPAPTPTPTPTPPGPTAPTPPGPAEDAGTVSLRMVNGTGGEIAVNLTGGTKIDQKLAAGGTVTLNVKPGSYQGSLSYWDGSTMAGKAGMFSVAKSEQWTLSLSGSGNMAKLVVAQTGLVE